MKCIITCLTLLIAVNGYGQDKITQEDLRMTIGNWEGSITYLDYQTGKPFTMPANLIVKQGKNGNSLVLKNIYPNEPKANNTDKIKVTKNGTLLNKNLVTSREEGENGHIRIQTEYKGKDDNKKALIRYTYEIGKDLFAMRKEVQFEGSTDWIIRSEFRYRQVE